MSPLRSLCFDPSQSCYRVGRRGDLTSVLVARCRVVAVLFRSVAMFSRIVGCGAGTGWRGSTLVVPFRVVGGGRGGDGE